MRVLFLILVVFVACPTSSWAKCSKKKVCTMMKTMGHFDILNQCPESGPLLAECKKVSDKKLEDLPAPKFVDNKNGTVTDTVNKLTWAKKGDLKKFSLKLAKEFAAGSDVDGTTGWRLPTLPELKTLMYRERVKNVSGKKSWVYPIFDDGRGHYYWTTTAIARVDRGIRLDKVLIPGNIDIFPVQPADHSKTECIMQAIGIPYSHNKLSDFQFGGISQQHRR